LIEVFLSGGIAMWPLLAVGLGIVYTAARVAAALRRAAFDDAGRGLQGLLFWGGMSVLLGLLGTVGGFVVMTQAAARAGSIDAQLIWGGVSLSLVTLAFGTALFILAAALWFPLRGWHQRALAASARS
jgi:biopolymer transport protein ExbB/TolQ